ncbi:hypothetical protein F5884DRAFT_860978 [Xylogone sp. PMI_703]|nr:hypothetical protein F5884DRAFT_860978 [Xylogone sp. PMI_703]
MSYVTESTTWPGQPIPKEYKSLLQRLYSISDTKDESIGRRLATEVFTPDGEIQIGARKIKGSDEIIASQKLEVSWEGVETKQHKLLTVEIINGKDNELYVTGRRRSRRSNGQETEKTFTSYIIIENTDMGPRISVCK